MNVIPRDVLPTFSGTPYPTLPKSDAPIAFYRQPVPPVLPDTPFSVAPQLIWVSGENTASLDQERTIIIIARLSGDTDGSNIQWITEWMPIIESEFAPSFTYDGLELFVWLRPETTPGALTVKALNKRKLYGPITLTVFPAISSSDILTDPKNWQLSQMSNSNDREYPS